MEVSMLTNFNDLGMNDLNLIHNHLQVNSLDDIFGPPTIPGYGNYNTYGLAGTNNNNNINQGLTSCKRSAQNDLVLHNDDTLMGKTRKKLKTDDWSPYDAHRINNNHVLNSQDEHHPKSNNLTMLSFTTTNSSNSSNQASSLVTPKEETAVSNVTFPCHQYDQMVVYQASFDKQSCILDGRPQVVDKKIGNNKFGSNMAQPSRDHIIAERKRREKLSQRFIALSATIPGLKKMDKATVLGDAIKYVKQLQEQVKKLEAEAKKKTDESAIYMKRSYVSAEDDDFTAETKCSSGSCDSPFPEIEARFSDNDVLIRINCEKKQGIIEKVMAKIEELHLMVISSSSLAFGGSALAVTIVAQMGSQFSITAKDLVRNLHTTIKKCSI